MEKKVTLKVLKDNVRDNEARPNNKEISNPSSKSNHHPRCSTPQYASDLQYHL